MWVPQQLELGLTLSLLPAYGSCLLARLSYQVSVGVALGEMPNSREMEPDETTSSS